MTIFILVFWFLIFVKEEVGSLTHFPSALCGQYHNRNQLKRNHRRKRWTREDGGHESVEVEIKSLEENPNFLTASYRFSNVSIPFRFRGYLFYPREVSFGSCSYLMKLFKPNPTLQQSLLTNHYNLSKLSLDLNQFEEISGCDILWNRLFSFRRFEWYFRGKLKHEPCFLPSSKNSSEIIQVKDDLYYWLRSKQLWVNDRVYDLDGNLLIGNLLNIPYQFTKST